MDETLFGLRVNVALGYDEAVEWTTAALKQDGFGVLTTIDDARSTATGSVRFFTATLLGTTVLG